MSALLKRGWDALVATATSIDAALCASPQDRAKRANDYHVEKAILEGRVDYMYIYIYILYTHIYMYMYMPVFFS